MAPPSLWRSAGPLVAGRAFSALVGFALPAVLARVLDRGEFGTYKQLYLVANLALYSLQFGLAQSLFYFVPRSADPSERRAFIGQTQLLLGLAGAAVALGLVAMAPLLAQTFSNPALAELSLPLALLAGALLASSPMEVALTASGRPVRSAIAIVLTDLVRIPAMLVPVLLGHGVLGLAWGAAFAALLRASASIALAAKPGALTGLGRNLRPQLVYALPFGAAVLLSTQQQQLHQIYVAAHATPALFALYAAGCLQVPIVGLLYSPVSETLQVRLAALELAGRTHESGEAFAEAVRELARVFLPLCALLVACAAPGLALLYGRSADGASYTEAASILRISVLSVAVSSLPVDGVLKARARTRALLWMYAAKLAVTWPLVALGHWALGLHGAIGAHVLVELLTKSGQLVYIARDLSLPVGALLGHRALLRPLAIASGVGLIAFGVVQFVSDPLLACVVSGLLATALVGAELWRSRRPRPKRPTPRERQAA